MLHDTIHVNSSASVSAETDRFFTAFTILILSTPHTHADCMHPPEATLKSTRVILTRLLFNASRAQEM
jgi:hypothetical protein